MRQITTITLQSYAVVSFAMQSHNRLTQLHDSITVLKRNLRRHYT
jgi:hypothetical protein